MVITERAPLQMRHGQYPDGSWRVECDIALRLSAATAVSFTGGAIEWRRADTGVPTQFDSLSAAQVAEFWGRSHVAAGTSAETDWTFWNEMAFRARLRFHYVGDDAGASGIVAHEVRCPARPALEGTYALRSVNGAGLPTMGTDWVQVHYDTLVFRPDFSYIVKSGTTWASQSPDLDRYESDPVSYYVISESELELPVLFIGTYAGRARLDGNAIIHDVQGQDRSYRWRFERVP